MHSGTLTQQSVCSAVQMVLSGTEELGCLQVVSDQVRLWQADTQRVRHQKAVLYDSFPTLQIYGLAANFARQHGWLLWQNDDQGRFVSQASAHDQMRTYIKTIK